jgi:hydrogenase nickel incorporation protein HypB
MTAQPRLVEVRERVLKQNDLLARALRKRFHEAGVYVISLVSSPGAGKTTILERTLTELRLEFRVAAWATLPRRTMQPASRVPKRP